MDAYQFLVQAETAYLALDFQTCISRVKDACAHTKEAKQRTNLRAMIERLEEEHYEHYIENGGLLH